MCNPVNTTAKQIFEAVIKSENILENYFLGICALVGGDFVFLPTDLKVYKVAPQSWTQAISKKGQQDLEANSCMFSLFLRIKFFLPTLRGIRY
jgi:tyrosine-protein phosphatase non-receptor type 13 protein